jgi:hypothetical protein
VNTNYLAQSLLGGYCSQVVKIYKCPDDILKCNETGEPNLQPQMDRVRSVSMNGFLQGGADIQANETAGYPINVDNYFASNGGPYVYGYNKLTEIIGTHGPGPADMIVFTDESCLTIDDGFFMPISPTGAFIQNGQIQGTQWENLPGDYHDKKGDTIGFADGHCEFHKWVSANVCMTPFEANPLIYSSGSPVSPPNVLSTRPDAYWILAHSTAPYP